MDAVTSGARRLRLGPYRVLEHVAAGGMAAVYKAVHEESGRIVALKVLPPDLADHEPARQRFRQEAMLGVRLCHENIVAVQEFGEAQGVYYLVMEFVEGISLSDQIEQHGTLDPDAARLITRQIAAALEHAHQLGIIHRDIKPGNILLTEIDGKTVAKLVDMGLSREPRDEDFKLTREGCTVGTVDYMSPEQARDSRAADIRSDLYSLGCSLFHMLTGSAPFPEGTLIERLMQHTEREPPNLRVLRPDVPADLAAICRKLLAKKPAQRFQTPAELVAALDGADVGLSDDSLPTMTLPRLTPSPEDTVPVPPTLAASAAVSAASAAPAAPTKKKRSSSEELPALDLPDDPSPATPEQQRVAQGQIELAKKLIKARELSGGLKCLRYCIRLDPTNTACRQALRELAGTDQRVRWPWFKRLYFQLRYKIAKLAKKPWQMLDYGEQALLAAPRDVEIHLDLIAAALSVGCRRLAWWLLGEARRFAQRSPAVQRELALFLEIQGEHNAAIRYWEKVERARPGDREAGSHIKAIAANETIARGNLQERIGDLQEHLDDMNS
jgi:serine/threonine protein kinase